MLLATAAIGWTDFAYETSVVSTSSRTPTAERPSAFNDHGRKLYIKDEESRRLAWMIPAMFLLTFTSLITSFYVIGFWGHFRMLIVQTRTASKAQ